MHKLILPFFLFTSLTGLNQAADAVISATTEPGGLTSVSCLTNSDTLVSVPFTRPPAFTGVVEAVTGGVLTVQGAPGWSANQFVYAVGSQPNHYYALIGAATTTNPKEGHAFPVIGNTANSLTLDLTADDLAGLAPNAQVCVIPYWTLGTLFPASDADVSFTPTTSTRAIKTEILIPNYNADGINPSSAAVYFFGENVNGDPNNGIGWRLFGDNVTDHGDDVLIPDGYITVRNLNGAPTLPLTSVGLVLEKKMAIAELTDAAAQRDNPVAMVRPLPVALNATGLGPDDGSFVATTSTRSPQDQLLVFDNSVTALNKSPSAVYIYGNNLNGDPNNGIGWRLFGDNATDHGTDQIAAGSALILRKAGNGTGETVFWVNSPSY